MMLAVVLSRAGIPVTVLEKHDDFLRDFRGDADDPRLPGREWRAPRARPGFRAPTVGLVDDRAIRAGESLLRRSGSGRGALPTTAAGTPSFNGPSAVVIGTPSPFAGALLRAANFLRNPFDNALPAPATRPTTTATSIASRSRRTRRARSCTSS
jgi:hypothetical protein